LTAVSSHIVLRLLTVASHGSHCTRLHGRENTTIGNDMKGYVFPEVAVSNRADCLLFRLNHGSVMVKSGFAAGVPGAASKLAKQEISVVCVLKKRTALTRINRHSQAIYRFIEQAGLLFVC
jgi:hypothetical protein